MSRYIRNQIPYGENHNEVLIVLVMIAMVLVLLCFLIVCNCLLHCNCPKWKKKREEKVRCDCEEDYFQHVNRLLAKHQEIEEKRRLELENLKENECPESYLPLLARSLPGSRASSPARRRVRHSSTSSAPVKRELKDDLEQFKVDHRVQIKAPTSPVNDTELSPRSVIVRRPSPALKHVSKAVSTSSFNDAQTQTIVPLIVLKRPPKRIETTV
ncbi:unnamed protein product [Bursaphelenchus okinawaensis]|uniref:Uncharacterized protein n=1 Tax=Bursaphelenchus okinawaensis TaxID=465554 RepID=A0A811L3J8_9BILA|nr:unnamed protein product [Bursaphelenchus okinawaensis]CAG9118480.1 unnamed protein product [Bursaphelenchus okinawaensis]